MISNSAGKEYLIRVFGIIVLHALPVIAIANGTANSDWILLACIWPFQVVGSTIALHRYFAHRAFRTSRVFQAFLALCAASAFGDPISFTGKHRIHHKYSDTEADVHSPRQGIWQCWIGNVLNNGYSQREILEHAKDLRRYPELVWLNNNKRTPGLILAVFLFLYGGFSAVAIGLALGVVSIIHIGGAVNYFCHRIGQQRFETNDNSTNSWLIALLSMGEGWHNNHHYYPSSARAGFFWWEIDILYYVICLFEKLGLVWRVRRPPKRVYELPKPMYEANI